jgi:predicted O-methyltransferase YrrM
MRQKIPHLVEMYNFIYIDASKEYGVYKAILDDSYDSLRDDGVLIGDDFELTLPISELLLGECRKSINKDLIYSKVAMEYVHPGIVLGLSDFIATHPNTTVEAINGVHTIYKNNQRSAIYEG